MLNLNDYSVTWDKESGLRLLAAAPMRLGWLDKWRAPIVEVYIEGEWMHLCRTSLIDDVCTFGCDDDKKELETVRKHYSDSIQYGVRCRRVNGASFAVIDSFSDG